MNEIEREKEFQSWQEWLKLCREKFGVLVERTALEPPEIESWTIKRNSGGKLLSIERSDGKFFRVVGFKGEYWHPGIEQIPDPEDPKEREGLVVQLIDTGSGDFLVQTRVEMLSDEPSHVTLAPTIQTGWHRIKSSTVPLLEYLGDIKTIADAEKVLDDFVTRETNPTRIAKSKNLYGIKFVDKKTITNKPENYRWFSQKELVEANKSGAPFNLHFEAPYRLYLSRTFQLPST